MVKAPLTVLVTRTCEFHKPNNCDCHLAEIRDLDILDRGQHGMIRKNSVRKAFHLPPIGADDDIDRFVDFRTIARVDAGLVRDALSKGGRVASLDDHGRRALVAQMILYLADGNDIEAQEDAPQRAGAATRSASE